MDRRIKINFTKFWEGFDSRRNLFLDVLSERFEVEISNDPDFLFYSVYPGDLPLGDSVRIFYSAENRRPDWEHCDWALTFDWDVSDDRHFRLPYYAFLGAGADLLKPKGSPAPKKKFCNFIYFKDVGYRMRFCRRLARYRPVDCPGNSLNNAPAIGEHSTPQQSRSAFGWDEEKLAYLSEYKFTIAFENESTPGYTTEKIYHGMLAGSIPIIWGNPLIDREFNPKSFVNVHECEGEVLRGIPTWLASLWWVKRFWIEPRTFDRVVRRVKEIDENDALYQSVRKEPWFHGNRVSPEADRNRLRSFLQRVVEAKFTDPASFSDLQRGIPLPCNSLQF